MEPTISLRDADSHVLRWTFPPPFCIFLLGEPISIPPGKVTKRSRWADRTQGRWAGLRGEFLQAGLCDRVAAGSGWALGTLSPPPISPRARQKGRITCVGCTCLLSVGAAGSALAQRPHPAPAVSVCGGQAAVVLLPTWLPSAAAPLSLRPTSSHPAGSVVSLCLPGHIFPTLHKHYFISWGLLTSARSSPPPAPTPSGLLARFNFHSWPFHSARDLRWKQFHRLVTHRVIIIGIPAPGEGGRKEERQLPVQPAWAGRLWGAGGEATTFPPAQARNSDFLRLQFHASLPSVCARWEVVEESRHCSLGPGCA